MSKERKDAIVEVTGVAASAAAMDEEMGLGEATGPDPDTLRLTAQSVLVEASKNTEINDVLVIGLTDSEFKLYSNLADKPRLIWMLEAIKHELIIGQFDAT